MKVDHKKPSKQIAEVEKMLKEKIKDIQDGSITVVIQDKQPIQINLNNKYYR